MREAGSCATRGGLPALLCAMFLSLCGVEHAGAEGQRYDLVLRNARIVDGSGRAAYRGEIAIRGDQIVRIASSIAEGADRVVDVGLLVAAPGFIDVHNHARSGIFQKPSADNLVRQGITTAIEGPDGSSPVPIGPFLTRLESLPKSINIGTFIGHGSVRERVIGRDNRAATPDELDKMRSLVEDGMKGGAFGLSSGLIYIPGVFAPTSEVIELAKVAGRMRGHYQTHIRSESGAVVNAVKEAIEIGKAADLPVQITHHKAVGESNWGRSIDTLRAIDEARARGLDVTIDQYPYTAIGGAISSSVPTWVREGDIKTVRDRLKDPEQRSKAASQIARSIRGGSLRGDLTRLAIARCGFDPTLSGRTLADIARSRAKAATPEAGAETIVWLIEQGGCGIVIQNSLSEKDVERILLHPATMIASDGDIPGSPGELRSGVPHPRSYGTFPRVLARYVRDRKLLTLETAIRKMTALPAKRLGLADRGEVRETMKADLVVFDPARVRDLATLDNPLQYAEGFKLIIVNGQIVVENDAVTAARPGRVLYGPGAASR